MLLNKVVTLGKAEEACLCDRQELLRRVFDHMEMRLNEALRAYSTTLVTHLQRLFRFGHARITEVPVVEEEIVFRREAPCTIQRLGGPSRRNVATLLQ